MFFLARKLTVETAERLDEEVGEDAVLKMWRNREQLGSDEDVGHQLVSSR